MHRLWLVGCLVVAVAGGPGCFGDGGGDSASGFTPVHEGVCAALEAARSGDQAGAQRGFADAHGGLHDLAAAVEEKDRAATARLLEAKQRVEAALRSPGSAPPAAELEALSGAVRGAIRANRGEPPRSCST
ncbi:MAG: hypothetical protein M3P34_01605 [Actinomycetota bacterium]|nr:hypothetical protein [Actinomycetota bacterium]